MNELKVELYWTFSHILKGSGLLNSQQRRLRKWPQCQKQWKSWVITMSQRWHSLVVGVAVIFSFSFGPLEEPVSGLSLWPSWLWSTITGKLFGLWPRSLQRAGKNVCAPLLQWEKKKSGCLIFSPFPLLLVSYSLIMCIPALARFSKTCSRCCVAFDWCLLSFGNNIQNDTFSPHQPFFFFAITISLPPPSCYNKWAYCFYND